MYIRALDSYERKDFENASAFINQSLKVDKNYKQAKFLKAKIHLFQGRYGDAQDILFDLFKHNSENKDIQIYLIQSLIFGKNYKRAEEVLDQALKNDCNDWRLFYYASLVAAKTGDTEERLFMLNASQRALEMGASVYNDLSFVWKSLGVDSKALEYREKFSVLGGPNAANHTRVD